jgi:hypothetical protein
MLGQDELEGRAEPELTNSRLPVSDDRAEQAKW